jgi:hypothetical protein
MGFPPIADRVSLEYQAPATGRRSRLVRRAILLVMIIGASGALVMLWNSRESIAANLAARAQQRAWAKAMEATTPGELVYADSRAKDALHSPELAIQFSPTRGTFDRALATVPGRAAPVNIVNITAFAGSVRSADGVKCLLIVGVRKRRDLVSNVVDVEVVAGTEQFATPWRSRVVLDMVSQVVTEASHGHVQVYRPKTDAADPSHLTFEVRWDGDLRLYDIWIRDGGRAIKIERRLDHPQITPPD